MKTLRWRVIVAAGTTLFAIYLLIPSVLKFGYGKSISKLGKVDDPWYYSILPSEVLKLGLDLRGGIHIVLGIDYDEVVKDTVLRLKTEIQELAEREKITGIKTETGSNATVVIRFEKESEWEKLDKKIGEWMGDRIDFVSQDGSTASVRMTSAYTDVVRSRAREQALETIRNRIDEFGLSEPIIQPHGEEKILVQFPGVGQNEMSRIRDVIGRTAKLSFQIVRTGPEEPRGFESMGMTELEKLVATFISEKGLKLSEAEPITKHLSALNEWASSKIPTDTEIIFQKTVDVNTKVSNYIPYLLNKVHIVSGDELEDAYYSFNQQTNEPIVNFTLNATGTNGFAEATGANIKRYMAIILDRNVHSAPRINSRIPGGRAIIEMGGGRGRPPQEVASDAKDTALVLRSGALPAKLEFLEERTIGPSLGADAIREGTLSLAVGLGLLLVFMTLYYRSSGLIAVLALTLNGLYVIAAMAAFEGTLTLPGLAGLTLTLGMAVDANVLIFEHMREELVAGKSVNLSIAEGYRRAFSAIFDSNVTTILAALVLMSFGYGPIKGFAVTLVIGLCVSMYTAVFVTRIAFDYLYVSKGKQSVSI